MLQSSTSRADIYFNSIKVRLKQDYYSNCLANPLFQFHKGTIKTVHFLYLIILYFNFNSIKVRLKLISALLLTNLWYFNSIKVRLKPSSRTRHPSFCQDFNSIKVRLKRSCSIGIDRSKIFQFHKGTIKTELKK